MKRNLILIGTGVLVHFLCVEILINHAPYPHKKNACHAANFGKQEILVINCWPQVENPLYIAESHKVEA